MPYTFGATISDVLGWTAVSSVGNTNTPVLVFGWFYPTALTSTKGYWAFGNIFGAEVDTVTSEIRLKSDASTTDGIYTTTGAGIAINQWNFIAVLGACGASGVSAFRVWTGTDTTAPVERTVTQVTAPVGTFTVGFTGFSIGNKGTTGTVAFQGDIAEIGYFATSAAVGATLHPFQMVTAGTLSQAVADHVRDRFVVPLWEGKGWGLNTGALLRNGVLNTSTDEFVYLVLNTSPQVLRSHTVNTTALANPIISFSGATPSIQTSSPRPLKPPSPYLPYKRH